MRVLWLSLILSVVLILASDSEKVELLSLEDDLEGMTPPPMETSQGCSILSSRATSSFAIGTSIAQLGTSSAILAYLDSPPDQLVPLVHANFAVTLAAMLGDLGVLLHSRPKDHWIFIVLLFGTFFLRLVDSFAAGILPAGNTLRSYKRMPWRASLPCRRCNC